MIWRSARHFSRAFARRTAATLVSLGAALATVMSLALPIPACSSGDVADGPGVTSPCPNGATCQVPITLLHTADIHSRLLPYDLLITQVDANLGLGEPNTLRNVGGVARMAYLLQRERARSGRSLHIEGGDCFQGAPIFNFFQGEPEMKVQSALGVDAMVIANHEFDLGPLNAARQIQRWANFPVLAANYKFEQADRPGNVLIGNVIRPFSVFNQGGLKVGVIGMANLSSLTSIFDQPNRLGIQPINTVETAQFYIDLLRPNVDLVVFTTHLGLEVDQRMIRNTTGIDVVLGSHNHIVLNPPQELEDCTADPQSPGHVWVMDPERLVDPEAAPPLDAEHPDPKNHPWQKIRRCTPRKVVLAHSGAFAKYVGRLDLVVSNDPKELPGTYDPLNRFEVVSQRYVAFPVDDATPEDPWITEILQPYRRQLDLVADLDILVGYSPSGSRRIASQGGDSPLGNLVSNSIWLRLGVQTDFSMTNSTGIRQDLLPGPVTVEQMYNIFPFDNSITKMQLSGEEVEEMFDFIARRSAGRGCTSQAQIAGARIRINCTGCTRDNAVRECKTDQDCPVPEPGACNPTTKRCAVAPCADAIYIGTPDAKCSADADCPHVGTLPVEGACRAGRCTCGSDDECVGRDGKPRPGACAKRQVGERGLCMSAVQRTNLYELATSNYLATGGSGFRVLQRNTTQVDTRIQQRDALIDYIRQGKPCGYRKDAGTAEGLKACSVDADCGSEGDFVCACAGRAKSELDDSGKGVCSATGPCDGSGRCVRRDCRNDVAQFHSKRCKDSPAIKGCTRELNPCAIAGESCKFLACVDETMGAFVDGRIDMEGR